MLKKFNLLGFSLITFLFLSCTNSIYSKRNFQLDEQRTSQLKQSIAAIHTYYDQWQNLGQDEHHRYEFDDHKIIKNNVEEISNSLSDFLFQDILTQNNFTIKYNWLMKHPNPIMREAAAYYYSANILMGKKEVSKWQAKFIDEFFSLLEDKDLNVRRAATYTLSTLSLKAKLDTKLANKIDKKINAINIQDSDPFIFGYSIFYLIRFKIHSKDKDKPFTWETIKNYYKNSHRFVRLCVIKTFRALINNTAAATWAYGLALDLHKSDDQEKLKDFHALAVVLASKQRYSESIFNLAWNNIYDKSIDKKLANIPMLTTLLKGDSVLLGNKIHVTPFLCSILSKNKIYIFQNVIEKEFKSDNQQIQESTLNLLSKFVTRIDDQYDFEVIQYFAGKGFNNSDINIKIAALKIFRNFVYKQYNCELAEQKAKQAWLDENVSLRPAALDIYKALVIKDQFLDESLNIFLEGINTLNSDSDINFYKFRKKLFELGKALAMSDYKIDVVIQAVRQIKNVNPDVELLFLDMCKELAIYKNFEDDAFELGTIYLNGNYSNDLTKKGLNIIYQLLDSNYKIDAIKNLATEMSNFKSSIKKVLLGLKIYTKLIKQNYLTNQEVTNYTWNEVKLILSYE